MKINQKGFSVVELLLVIITVTLVVGVGFYVYNSVNSKKGAQQKSDNPQKTQEEKPKLQKTKTTFDFDGLKVEVPQDGLKGLLYAKDTDPNSKNSSYNVNNTEFNSIAAKCTDTKPQAVSIHAERGRYPGEGNEGMNGLLKQFNNYYITYSDGGLYGNIGCSDILGETKFNQLFDIQKQITEQLKNAFANSQEVN